MLNPLQSKVIFLTAEKVMPVCATQFKDLFKLYSSLLVDCVEAQEVMLVRALTLVVVIDIKNNAVKSVKSKNLFSFTFHPKKN